MVLFLSFWNSFTKTVTAQFWTFYKRFTNTLQSVIKGGYSNCTAQIRNCKLHGNIKLFYTEATDASPLLHFLKNMLPSNTLLVSASRKSAVINTFKRHPLLTVCGMLNCVQANKSYVSQTTIWGTLSYFAKSVLWLVSTHTYLNTSLRSMNEKNYKSTHS